MDFQVMITNAGEMLVGTMVLVAVIKKLGVSGIGLTRSSLAVGFGLGMVSQYALGIAPTVLGWLVAVLVSLFVGAGACGAYDLGDRWLSNKSTGPSGGVG